MPNPITITPCDGRWSVRAGGAILGETTAALRLEEAGMSEVIYFPRDDIAMAFLEPSDTTSTCPRKGTATYFDVVTKSGTIKDAAWSYEAPLDGATAIAGHLAFYQHHVTVAKI